MTNRAAYYSVQGYLYQFHKAIKEVLSSGDDAKITIEGIEDIDVHTSNAVNLVQCKYHEAQQFKKSLLYKPVGLMLKHSIESLQAVSIYTLYAHFADGSPDNDSWITCDFLRKAFTHVNKKEKSEDTPNHIVTVSNEQLDSFKRKFRADVKALPFNEMRASVISELQSALNCTPEEVELYYYNQAIAYITELAARKDTNQRQLTKTNFKAKINKKILLFDIWQHELSGRQAYIDAIKARLKAANALADTKRRFLFISRELVNCPTAEVSLSTLLQNLVNQYGIVGKLYNTALWTVIIDAEATQIHATKEYLVKNSIYFNDGYEAVSFCGRYFNDMPLTYKKRTGDKIAKASHNLRLLSADTFKEKLDYVVDTDKHPHVFINTTRSLHDNQFFLDSPNVSVYRLAALDNLADLNEVIKKSG